jgi:hypothetical protein
MVSWPSNYIDIQSLSKWFSTYFNDNLDYLWVQLDQNQQAKDSESPLAERITQTFPASNFTDKFLKKPLERGFNIEYVKDSKGV